MSLSIRADIFSPLSVSATRERSSLTRVARSRPALTAWKAQSAFASLVLNTILAQRPIDWSVLTVREKADVHGRTKFCRTRETFETAAQRSADIKHRLVCSGPQVRAVAHTERLEPIFSCCVRHRTSSSESS